MFTTNQTSDAHTLAFTVDRDILDRGSQTYESASMAAFSPLASALFGVAGVARVELSRNQITITKDPSLDWKTVLPDLEAMLRSYFA